MFDIQEELKRLPDSPGVYLMKNSVGEIIYVGKAKSLRKRVRQYFAPIDSLAPKVRVMVSHIARFDYILVDNEVEALILESNLIKENRPRYNILLRDDKQYPYIKITDEKYPRVLKVRQIHKGDGEYFGPYPSAYAVNDLIRLFEDIYPLRTCNLNFNRGDQLKRPCLNYFMGRCMAPCVGKADEKKYLDYIEQVRDFLKGDVKDVRQMLTAQMEDAAKKMEYERAARIRDTLEHIDVLMEKQNVSSTRALDMDAIAIIMVDDMAAVQVFFIRNGKIVGQEDFLLDAALGEEKDDVLSNFIQQFYFNMNGIPGTILCNIEPRERILLEDYLREKRGKKVEIQIPQRGKKKDLVEMVQTNAKAAYAREFRRREKRERQSNKPSGLDQLEQILELNNLHRIEAYDISNISGSLSVGSMVVYEKGKKAPKEYRKFKIRSVDGADDYASLREVLERRFKRAINTKDPKFSKLPDLIMMDGGKGQVSSALQVLDKMQLAIPVCGLVKDDHHTTRGIIYENREILLPLTSPAFRLIYSIQEEAHRFALSYHHSLRDKTMVKSILDEIPGIGIKRKKELLKRFGSIEGIRKAQLEEIENTPSMTKKLAKDVYDFVRREE